MIPRIRGKLGQATDPGEYQGKWFFELWLTELGGGGGDGMSLGQFGPWDSEEIAGEELRKAAQLACEAIEQSMDGKVSGKYIDMKTNEMRSWDERTH